MAKSKAQLITLLQELARFVDDVDTFATGTFSTDYDLVSTAIAAGDDEAEDAEMRAALAAVLATMDTLSTATQTLFASVHKSLGRYAGRSSLATQSENLAAFFQKVDDDSQAFERRGLTKFSALSADGGNIGSGAFVVGGLDLNGDPIDCAHVETVTLECVSDSIDGGSIAGSEAFKIYGSRASGNSFEDFGASGAGAGSGDSGAAKDYVAIRTGLTGNWAKNAKVVRPGGLISVASGGNTANILANGNFEAALVAGETTAKIQNWTLNSDYANATIDTTNPMVGTNAFEISGDLVMTQALSGTRGVKTRVPLCVSLYARKVGTVSAGALTLKIKDDTGTHATLTIADLSALTTSFALSTPVVFILPSGVGANLRAEIEVTSWSGAGTVLLDEVVLTEMSIYDTGYYFAVLRGPADWREGDKATASTTSAESGKVSRAFNRCLKVAPKAAASATDWTDYS